MARLGFVLLELDGTGEGVLRTDGGFDASSTCMRLDEVLAPEVPADEGGTVVVVLFGAVLTGPALAGGPPELAASRFSRSVPFVLLLLSLEAVSWVCTVLDPDRVPPAPPTLPPLLLLPPPPLLTPPPLPPPPPPLLVRKRCGRFCDCSLMPSLMELTRAC